MSPDENLQILYISCILYYWASQEVNFSMQVPPPRSLQASIFLDWRQQPVRQFKCAFLRVTEVEKLSFESNMVARGVITHSSLRRSLCGAFALTN